MSRKQFTGSGRLLKVVTISDMDAPTVSELTAVAVKDLTGFLRQDGLNRSQEAALVDTATALDLFDTTDIGTRSGKFDLTLYRDDETDTAWNELPIGTRCYLVVAPWGFTGVAGAPAAADPVEVWKIAVSNRSNAQIGKDTAQTFTVTCAVVTPPKDDAAVAA